jgi:hypothetical protein
MSGQPRHMSAVESVTNVLVGYLLALVTQAYLFPVFGLYASHSEHMAIAAVFTVISLLRSFALRRAFNWIGRS